MDKLQRYSLVSFLGSSVLMADDKGKVVHADDAATLEAEVDRLKLEISQINEANAKAAKNKRRVLGCALGMDPEGPLSWEDITARGQALVAKLDALEYGREGMNDPSQLSQAEKQVKELADYIMGNVPGEPSVSESAVSTAIRLLSTWQADMQGLRHALSVATGRVAHKDGGFSSPAVAYEKNAVRRLRPVVVMGAADMEPSPGGYVSATDYDWLVDQFEAVKVQLDMAHAEHVKREKVLREANQELADAAVKREPVAVTSTVGAVTQTELYEHPPVGGDFAGWDEPKERAVFECTFEYARENWDLVVQTVGAIHDSGVGYIKVVTQSE